MLDVSVTRRLEMVADGEEMHLGLDAMIHEAETADAVDALDETDVDGPAFVLALHADAGVAGDDDYRYDGDDVDADANLCAASLSVLCLLLSFVAEPRLAESLETIDSWTLYLLHRPQIAWLGLDIAPALALLMVSPFHENCRPG